MGWGVDRCLHPYPLAIHRFAEIMCLLPFGFTEIEFGVCLRVDAMISSCLGGCHAKRQSGNHQEKMLHDGRSNLGSVGDEGSYRRKFDGSVAILMTEDVIAQIPDALELAASFGREAAQTLDEPNNGAVTIRHD